MKRPWLIAAPFMLAATVVALAGYVLAQPDPPDPVCHATRNGQFVVVDLSTCDPMPTTSEPSSTTSEPSPPTSSDAPTSTPPSTSPDTSAAPTSAPPPSTSSPPSSSTSSTTSSTGPTTTAPPTTTTEPPSDNPRAPRADEVDLRIFQYASGNHPLPIACADNPDSGHVHDAPVYNLEVDRPFEYRIEPRWKGGSEPLDVIFEVKVDANILPFDGDKQLVNTWAQLVHLGPQTKNREMAQIGQHVTLGRGDFLHPMPGFPIEYHMRVDFQLGKQNGPKRVCEGRVLVSRAP